MRVAVRGGGHPVPVDGIHDVVPVLVGDDSVRQRVSAGQVDVAAKVIVSAIRAVDRPLDRARARGFGRRWIGEAKEDVLPGPDQVGGGPEGAFTIFTSVSSRFLLPELCVFTA